MDLREREGESQEACWHASPICLHLPPANWQELVIQLHKHPPGEQTPGTASRACPQTQTCTWVLQPFHGCEPQNHAAQERVL